MIWIWKYKHLMCFPKETSPSGVMSYEMLLYKRLGMHLGSFKDSKVSYYSAVFSAQQLRNHNRTKEAKNDFRHLYAMMRFCYRLLLFFQVLFLVRSVGDNLMTQATGRGTLSAHTEAKGNGPALCVGNQCGRGEPLSPYISNVQRCPCFDSLRLISLLIGQHSKST